jgi:hypothetical protein
MAKTAVIAGIVLGSEVAGQESPWQKVQVYGDRKKREVVAPLSSLIAIPECRATLNTRPRIWRNPGFAGLVYDWGFSAPASTNSIFQYKIKRMTLKEF